MKKVIATALTLLLVAVSLNNCATLISGTSQNIAIESEPRDATVRVETIGGVEIATGKTPFSVSLKRKDEYMVIIRMTGYRESRIQITKEFNPVAVLSVAAGMLGIFVDLATGAAWNLKPERIVVTLQRAHLGNPEAVINILYSDGRTRVIRVPMVPEEGGKR